LPLPEGPHDGEEARLLQPAGEILDELLSPEEEVAVLRLEGKKTLVGAGDVCGRKRVVGQARGRDGLLLDAGRGEAARQSVEDELEEPLRLGQVLESMRPEIAHRDGAVGDERLRPLGEDHLAAVRGRGYSRAPVDVDPDVVVAGDERISGVQAHANAHIAVGPAVRGQSALPLLRRRERLRRIREGNEEAIALRIDLDASVSLEALSEQTPVIRQSLGVSVAERLQEARRPLDVGEEEGNAARRKFGHSRECKPVRSRIQLRGKSDV
jgi:hypothetical protein